MESYNDDDVDVCDERGSCRASPATYTRSSIVESHSTTLALFAASQPSTSEAGMDIRRPVHENRTMDTPRTPGVAMQLNGTRAPLPIYYRLLRISRDLNSLTSLLLFYTYIYLCISVYCVPGVSIFRIGIPDVRPRCAGRDVAVKPSITSNNLLLRNLLGQFL